MPLNKSSHYLNQFLISWLWLNHNHNNHTFLQVYFLCFFIYIIISEFVHIVVGLFYFFIIYYFSSCNCMISCRPNSNAYVCIALEYLCIYWNSISHCPSSACILHGNRWVCTTCKNEPAALEKVRELLMSYTLLAVASSLYLTHIFLNIIFM